MGKVRGKGFVEQYRMENPLSLVDFVERAGEPAEPTLSLLSLKEVHVPVIRKLP